MIKFLFFSLIASYSFCLCADPNISTEGEPTNLTSSTDSVSSEDSEISLTDSSDSVDSINPFHEPIPHFKRSEDLRTHLNEIESLDKTVIVDVDLILQSDSRYTEYENCLENWDFEGVHHLFVKAKHAYDFIKIFEASKTLQSVTIYEPQANSYYYTRKRLTRLTKNGVDTLFFGLNCSTPAKFELRDVHRLQPSCSEYVFYLLVFENILNNLFSSDIKPDQFHKTWLSVEPGMSNQQKIEISQNIGRALSR